MSRRWEPSTRLRLAVETVMHPDCDECGEPVGAETGCFHNGRALCRADLHFCPECHSAIRDSFGVDL